MTDAAAEPEILCERRGAAGIVVLNRPKALNALTSGMVRGLAAALDAWDQDPAVTRVVVTGAGDRAFCAGGDIRQLYDNGLAGQAAASRAFWREEYVLNHRIKTYPKPYVALIDGIVMGGGVGVSLHGSHRVAGGRYLFAMPEVGIGFFPDVGATHVLPRLPDRAGLWLALTGARVKQADALALGLATHAAESSSFPALLAALCAGDDVDAVLARFAVDPGPAPWQASRAVIADAFGETSVPAILDRLAALADAGSAEAATLRASFAGKSPTSLVLTLEQMRRGAALDFAAAMDLEFRIVWRMADHAEFFEGVRAVVVDKDQAPRWNPASLDAVDADAVIARFMAPLGIDELGLAVAA